MKYPELVTKLTTLCDGWIVGTSANPSILVPRDYDIWIPLSKWGIACALMPKHSRLNRLGGFKCKSEGKEVDVWTCEMEKMLASNYFTYAYHPATGITIKREK